MLGKRAFGSAPLGARRAAVATPRTLIAERGTITRTGRSANLLAGHTLPAAGALLALQGRAADLRRARATVAAVGGLNLTGRSAILRRGVRSIGERGAVTLTGQQAALVSTRRLVAQTAATSMQGGPAIFARLGAYAFGASGSAVLVTGTGISLIIHRRSAPAAGTLTIGGQPTALRLRRCVAGEVSAMRLSGIAVSFQLTSGTNGPSSPIVPSLRSIRIYDQAKRLVRIF